MAYYRNEISQYFEIYRGFSNDHVYATNGNCDTGISNRPFRKQRNIEISVEHGHDATFRQSVIFKEKVLSYRGGGRICKEPAVVMYMLTWYKGLASFFDIAP
jgi:hypothetical protein